MEEDVVIRRELYRTIILLQVNFPSIITWFYSTNEEKKQILRELTLARLRMEEREIRQMMEAAELEKSISFFYGWMTKYYSFLFCAGAGIDQYYETYD